jgi:hypothetical protein
MKRSGKGGCVLRYVECGVKARIETGKGRRSIRQICLRDRRDAANSLDPLNLIRARRASNRKGEFI